MLDIHVETYYTIQAVNNKGADQTAFAPLLFAYGRNRFSHDVAHLLHILK